MREREDANRTRVAGSRDEVEGVVANTLNLSSDGAVGFIDWLDRLVLYWRRSRFADSKHLHNFVVLWIVEQLKVFWPSRFGAFGVWGKGDLVNSEYVFAAKAFPGVFARPPRPSQTHVVMNGGAGDCLLNRIKRTPDYASANDT